MAYFGVAFRATAGYVTDGAGNTYCLGEAYPVTRGGLTFGWSINLAANSRDRNSGIDARLAGCNFVGNSGGVTRTFTLDLPSGAGTYRVRMAIGDFGSAQNNRVLIKDGSTTLATVDVDTIANRFTDTVGSAAGSGGFTDGGWVSGNVVAELAFSGSSLVLEVGGDSSGTFSSALAYVGVEFVGGGGGATSLPPRRAFNPAILNH